MNKSSKNAILKKQEQDLARVLWVTFARWGLLPERDNEGTKLRCPLLELGKKWSIKTEQQANICLECIFTKCVLYE